MIMLHLRYLMVEQIEFYPGFNSVREMHPLSAYSNFTSYNVQTNVFQGLLSIPNKVLVGHGT